MILVDFSQVTYASLMIQLGFDSSKLNEVDENMLRHLILNSLRSYNTNYKSKYGEMVIACDSSSWRKDVFPYYKANRKKSRDESSLNWEHIYTIIGGIREEIKSFLPYKVVHVEKAEADDIIATLSRVNQISESILILSGDKDFIQLQDKNIQQYDPTRKKWVTHSNPKEYMLEHIIRGDNGDGIPNILSNDNCLVIGERQKPITSKRLEDYKNGVYSEQIARNFARNKTLIDLANTPKEIKSLILENYNNQINKDRSKLLPYFMEKKLKILTENIADF
jgi:5'-3' exonuclease